MNKNWRMTNKNMSCTYRVIVYKEYRIKVKISTHKKAKSYIEQNNTKITNCFNKRLNI